MEGWIFVAHLAVNVREEISHGVAGQRDHVAAPRGGGSAEASRVPRQRREKSDRGADARGVEVDHAGGRDAAQERWARHAAGRARVPARGPPRQAARRREPPGVPPRRAGGQQSRARRRVHLARRHRGGARQDGGGRDPLQGCGEGDRGARGGGPRR